MACSQKLSTWVIEAIDEFNNLRKLQLLLLIGIEQFEIADPADPKRTDEAFNRIGLLLNCYLQDADCRFDELGYCLNQIRDMTQSQTETL